MTYTTTNPTETALTVAQQAIQRLAKWTEVKLVEECGDASDPIARAWKLLSRDFDGEFTPLELLFDQVKLSKEQGQTQKHYWAPIAIPACHPPVPYPQTEIPDQAQMERLKQQIKPVLEGLTASDWQNLTLLMLILEKFASYISLDGSNVAFLDQVRATSAIAAALATDVNATHLSLVAGDLSGIQNFIYTISSDGALKSLRARSFYLELVTEEVVQQLLEKLDLPRTSVIYAGGGNLYLIAPTEEIEAKIAEVRERLNHWLREQFQGKVFLALACQQFEAEKVGDKRFADEWDQAIRLVNQQKTQKFLTQLESLLNPRPSYAPCKVCHRDDVPEEQLARLKDRLKDRLEEDLEEDNEPDSPMACITCRNMFKLGDKLFEVNSIVRSRQAELSGALHTIAFNFSQGGSDAVYYHLYAGRRPIISNPEFTFLINNWTLEDYRFRYFQGRVTLLRLGNYFQQTTAEDEQGFIRAEEMAEKAEGIKRVGYLRMDVDRLGQLFAKGLDANYSLAKLASLSRLISYFFAVYLKSLAGDRQANFLSHSNTHHFKALTTAPRNAEDEKHLRRNLLFIYAGGDDLFVSGSWDEVVEFAFDVYQSFRAYTGNHPDIKLSGGISIEDVKFPLYQAADESGEAEDAAKGNGRDSLGLFGSAFKWSEWLGIASPEEDEKANPHLDAKDLPELFGVLEFVKILRSQLAGSYSRSFVRNLLITAELQEQAIQEKQQAIDALKKSTPNHPDIEKLEISREEIRYYLHLPKIAYTLARLPNALRQESSPFKPVRTSLKSPYNAPYFRAIATWIELLSRNS